MIKINIRGPDNYGNEVYCIIPMNILADSNIIFAKEAFSALGTVTVVDGRDITREKCEGMDAILVRSITEVNRELLEGTGVKFVASATIGTDHVDRDYLRDNSIGFAHAPGSNANSVAEYVVSAMVHLADKKERALSGLTLGIIGVGNIGSRVMALAQTLGMRCLLNDPPKKALTGSDIYLPLTAVLRESDIVTVHVPLSNKGPDATYHLVNNDFFSAMKKGAMFINTSRGDVLDENSLKKARPKLSGVALDVWSNEPKPHAATMAACEIATPHIAGYSYDGKVYGTVMLHDALCAYFFKPKSWHAPDMAGDRKQITLDKIKNDDCVSAAVSAAYPIMDDDARLRKILDMDTEKQGAFFDNLRRTYPKRLEFRNYSVSTARKFPASMMSTLMNLGFKVSATP
jgi:erythronate-4-phosphate dehydrogenase